MPGYPKKISLSGQVHRNEREAKHPSSKQGKFFGQLTNSNPKKHVSKKGTCGESRERRSN